MPQSLPSVDNGSHYSSTAISFFPFIFLVGSLSFFYVLFWPHLSNRVKAQYKKKHGQKQHTVCQTQSLHWERKGPVAGLAMLLLLFKGQETTS